MSDGILRGIIKESKDRIHSISLIHEQLYCSNDFTKVDCGEYIRILANHLFRSFGVESDTIDLGFSMGEVSLTLDTAIPLGLIINELVSNSIKHAFPSGGGGEIKIDFGKKNGSEYELIVADNGVGLPAGLDISHTKSLGLRLVNILVKQLNGTLDSYPCEGVGFKIRFH